MKKEKLSNLCKVSNGFAFKSDDYVGHGYRVMRITNVQKGFVVDNDPKFIPQEIADKVNGFKLGAGDILISLTGNVGRVGRVQPQHLPAVLNQRVGLIRPSSEEINDKYLFQCLNSDKFEREAIQNSNGIAQLNLSSKWIENYEIPVPPLDDQVRIAHLLSKVEGLIAQRKQHLQQLDELLKSVFLEMFGDVDGLPTMPLLSIAAKGKGTFSNGPFGSDLLTSELIGAGVPVVYIRDIREARYVRVSTVCVTEEKATELSACIVQPGDILVAKVGDPPGTTAIYPKGEPIGVMTQDVIRLRPNTEIVNAEFVSAYLNSHFGRRLIREITVVATRARFGLREFKAQEIPIPPMDLQKKFASIVEKVEDIKSRYQQGLTDLETLYGAVSQQAFKGELDLSRVPLAVAAAKNK